jgi:fibrillarin-like pre-rRNA processing protein
MMKMKQIFSGVYRDGNALLTANAVPDKRVYGEQLINKNGTQFREWNPNRSKLGAAIANGMKSMHIKEDSKVLYLGASTGTTVSHVSDITKDGIIYALEFAERVFRSLIDLSAQRKNIIPILADARKPEEYDWIEEVDVIFVDIAQPDETQIAIRNAKEFLKENGHMMISVKSRSIDVTKDPKQIYKEERKKLEESGFEIIDIVNLEPFEKDHAMILCKKRT